MRYFDAVPPYLNFVDRVKHELREIPWRAVALAAILSYVGSALIGLWSDFYLASHSVVTGGSEWIFVPFARFIPINDVYLQVTRFIILSLCYAALWHAIPWIAERWAAWQSEGTDPSA